MAADLQDGHHLCLAFVPRCRKTLGRENKKQNLDRDTPSDDDPILFGKNICDPLGKILHQITDMNARLFSVLRQSASVFFVFGVMAYVYSCFHKYDWGHPLIKLFCFMTVFFLILFLRSRADSEPPSPILAKIEVVVWAIVLVLLATVNFKSYGPGLLRPPSIDVGFTTVRATTTFFQEGLNPYSVDNINVRSGLPVEYRGFHYGPMMFIGYFLALFSPAEGYKFATLIYLILSALLLILLLQRNSAQWCDWAASALFAICLFFLPERLWYELFLQGRTTSSR